MRDSVTEQTMALLTDLYDLTMAQSYFYMGRNVQTIPRTAQSAA